MMLLLCTSYSDVEAYTCVVWQVPTVLGAVGQEVEGSLDPGIIEPLVWP